MNAIGSALGSHCRFAPPLSGGIGGCTCEIDPGPTEIAPRFVCAPPPGANTPAFARLQKLAPRLRRAASDGDPVSLQARALWTLVWSDEPEDMLRAISNLEQALSLSPTSAELLADLAAANLLLASVTQEARYLVEARERALESAEVAPSERVERLLHLSARALLPEEMKHRIEGTVQPDCAIHRARFQEEILPDWISNASDAAKRATVEELLARIGRALSHLCSDESAMQVAKSLASLEDHDLTPTVAGLHGLLDGMRSYSRYDLENAEFELGRARRELLGRVRPLGLVATLGLSAVAYQGGDLNLAARLLATLNEKELASYPTLRARWHWQLGTLALARADSGNALRHYDLAAKLFDDTGDLESGGAVAALSADQLLILQDAGAAWRSLLMALPRVSSMRTPRHQLNVLSVAAVGAERLGALRVASEFARLGAKAVEQSEEKDAWFYALLYEGRLFRRRERWQELSECRRRLEDVLASEEAAPRRELLTSDMALELTAFTDQNGARTWAGLEAAIAVYAKRGFDSQALRARVALTRLGAEQLAKGGPETSERELLNGLGSALSRAPSAARRRASAEVREVVDLLLERLTASRPAIQTLAVDQWARIQMLGGVDVTIEQVESLLRALTSASRHENEQRLVTVFRVLPSRIVRWELRDGEWTVDWTELSVALAERASERLRWSLERGSWKDVERVASDISVWTLVGNRAEAPTGEPWIVVPDGWMWGLPLAAVLAHGRGDPPPEIRVCLLVDARLLHRGGAMAGETRQGVGLAGFPVGSDDSVLPALDPSEWERTRHTQHLGSRLIAVVGEEATKQRALELLESSRWIAFATHLIEGGLENEGSGLLFAGRNGTSESRLGAVDLQALDLRGLENVLLASCRSAFGGRAGFSIGPGLSGAFLAAGARSVVGTLWDVDDRLASSFSVSFLATAPLRGDIRSAFERAVETAFGEAEPQPEAKRWSVFQLIWRDLSALEPMGEQEARL